MTEYRPLWEALAEVLGLSLGMPDPALAEFHNQAVRSRRYLRPTLEYVEKRL